MHYARWRTHGDPSIRGTKRVDLTGRRFGHLQVKALHASDMNGTRWAADCDCGGTAIVQSGHLVSGHTRSCGCRNGLTLDRRGLARVKAIYRRNARDRSISWALKDEEFAALIVEPCHYCGAAPSNSVRGRVNGAPFIYSGVDRVRNSRGYTKANCVACCRDCNLMKRDMSYGQFLDRVRKVAAHLALA